MTRKEAKEKLYMEWQKFLENNIDYAGISEAYKMAFKALEQQPCEDAISREAVDELSKELVHTTRDKADFLCNFWEGLQKLPPVTPQPKTGRWIEHFDESGKWYECDQCHTDWGGSVNYCPNCGARMVEPKEKRCEDCDHYGKLSLDCGRCDDDCSMFEPKKSEG